MSTLYTFFYTKYKLITNKINKIVIIFILLFFSLITFTGYTYHTNQLYLYTGEIEHLAMGTLISFPDKALNKNNDLRIEYDESKLTINEFIKILESLYKNNYILISINELYEAKDGLFYEKDLYIPKEKKPIILSFDNVTYKSNYQNMGQIDKIIIDRNNNLASYTTKQGIQDRVQYNNEFILILENFLKTHPDFSYNNARGIIFFTGEDGILGYNTNHKNASCKYESKRASSIIRRLSALGWQFGCNNYSYVYQDSISELEFAKQISLWNSEIKKIIGKTNLYAFPYGVNDNNITKQEILLNNGFQIYFTNSNTPKLEIYRNSIHMTRREINGNTLRSSNINLEHLFNPKDIYDSDNRKLLYN